MNFINSSLDFERQVLFQTTSTKVTSTLFNCVSFFRIVTFQAYFAIGSNDVNKLFTFSAKDIHNEEVSLDAFKGKVIIIVNVASVCGFTDISYKELQQIY